MSTDVLVELGICTKPHGIKGGFTFSLPNTENSLLVKGIVFTAIPRSSESSLPESGQLFKISNISFGNKTIVYLEDISDRNVVESIIPFKICVKRSEFPAINDDEYYLRDLIGMNILSFEDGCKIGVVTDFYDNTAQIVLVIKLENELIEVPFIDNFFPNVDFEKREITLIRPRYEDES